MIIAELDFTTQYTDPSFKRKLREAKLACKEAANWQCEWLYPNGARCSARQNQIHRKKGKGSEPDGWKVTKLHGCHIDRNDPLNPKPRLICFCAKHHMEFDRNAELAECIRQYRRGYQLTSTDTLIQAMRYCGIFIREESNGYYWQIEDTGSQGTRTTAIGAVGAAIAQLRGSLDTTLNDLKIARREIAELRLAAAQKEQDILQLRQALQDQPEQAAGALFTYITSYQ